MVARPVSLALLFLNPFFHLGPLPLSCLCKHWAPRRSVRVRPTPRQRRKVSSPTPKPRPAEDPSPPSPKRIALGLYVRARVLWDFWEILKTPRVEVSSLRVWPGGGFAQAGSAGQYHAKKNPKGPTATQQLPVQVQCTRLVVFIVLSEADRRFEVRRGFRRQISVTCIRNTHYLLQSS